MIADNRNELSQRVIHNLKRRSTPGILFYPLIALIVIISDDFYSRHTGFSLWFGGLVFGICLFRIVHRSVARTTATIHDSLNNAIFFVSVGLTALLWGIWFARFMVLEDEHTVKLLMAICTAGLSAGGVVAFVPSLRLSIVFNFAMLVPVTALLAFRQSNPPLVISLLMFSIYLILMAYRANREYWQALENERLLTEQSEALKMLSRIDGLTALCNRRHFDERFDLELKLSTRIQSPPTIMICDIDHFKRINDQYGHQAGDEFLRFTAGLFKSVFKRDTDLVARYGGEEFIVLLSDTRPEAAYALAEEMRRRMAEGVLAFKGHRIRATMSIGIASANAECGDTRDSLVGRADKALYSAKQKGRNLTVVAPWDGQPQG